MDGRFESAKKTDTKKKGGDSNNQKKLELESMSPATKLLEKRRLMYEEQEKYEANKDEFKRKEEIFKNKESELISLDLSLQNHMIGFSNILQENERKKAKATNKINTEMALINEKDDELMRKRQELETLKRQTANISIKVNSMKAYEKYLEDVKDKNQDEYSELSDIRSRYVTLKESNMKLNEKQEEIQKEFEDLKTRKNQYFNTTKIEIMSLNNQITNKQSEYEKMEDLKNKIKGFEEEETVKQLKKTCEIGLILMAIDNIYNKWADSKSHLRYRVIGETANNKKFENFSQSTDLAINKLSVISEYYEDFEKVIKELEKEK